jgi:predicted nucleic acid-binding protein
MNYYIDTSIWLDFYEDRKDDKKNLGEIAYNFLKKILFSNSAIIVSNHTIHELKTRLTDEQINGLFLIFENAIINIPINYQHRKEANEIAVQRHIPKGDALHTIISQSADAILITRDKHFEKLKDICVIAKPEDFL